MTTLSARREDGRITLLVLGFAVVVLSLVVGVIDVTALQLSRARLFDIADAAALDAADSLAEGAAYRGGVDRRVPVSDATVLDAARVYLASKDRPPYVTSWRLGPATGTPDGRSAQVQLSGVVEMPLGGALVNRFAGPVTVSVESHATARIG